MEIEVGGADKTGVSPTNARRGSTKSEEAKQERVEALQRAEKRRFQKLNLLKQAGLNYISPQTHAVAGAHFSFLNLGPGDPKPIAETAEDFDFTDVHNKSRILRFRAPETVVFPGGVRQQRPAPLRFVWEDFQVDYKASVLPGGNSLMSELGNSDALRQTGARDALMGASVFRLLSPEEFTHSAVRTARSGTADTVARAAALAGSSSSDRVGTVAGQESSTTANDLFHLLELLVSESCGVSGVVGSVLREAVGNALSTSVASAAAAAAAAAIAQQAAANAGQGNGASPPAAAKPTAPSLKETSAAPEAKKQREREKRLEKMRAELAMAAELIDGLTGVHPGTDRWSAGEALQRSAWLR